MLQLILIFCGGGLGSLLRFVAGQAVQKSGNGFPLGTFIINIVGSLLIGLLLGYFGKTGSDSQNLKALFVIGFCGGFTTFSAFSNESLILIQQNQFTHALLYILSSIVLGILATFIGYWITK